MLDLVPFCGEQSNYIFNATHMVGASYGDHWRSLRRITTAEIFSSMKLCMFLCIRKDEIRQLLLRLSRDSLHTLLITLISLKLP
ncbi:hypothetical protein YC2023_024359 [Brassica napus]